MKLTAIPLLLLPILAVGQPPADQQAEPACGAAETMNLDGLIEQAADELGVEIIVDPRLSSRGCVGYTTQDPADYESLLAVLRNYNFVAVRSGDQLLIAPAQLSRVLPTRVLNDDDPTVSNHEVVTRVIVLPDVSTPFGIGENSAFAPQLIPVLRPMLDQNAQLGAIPGTNTLVLVDRYDNVRRITAIIDEIVAGLGD